MNEKQFASHVNEVLNRASRGVPREIALQALQSAVATMIVVCAAQEQEGPYEEFRDLQTEIIKKTADRIQGRVF